MRRGVVVAAAVVWLLAVYDLTVAW